MRLIQLKRSMFAAAIIPGLLLFIVAAAGTEFPRLKPGLWEFKVQLPDYPGQVPGLNRTTVCVGAMPDQQRQLEQDNIRHRCSKVESHELGGKWVWDAVCTARGHTVTKHVITSLAGDSVHEENSAPQGKMISDGKWLGACKAGEKPDIFK